MQNRKIARYGSAINFCAVIAFAVCMPLGSLFGCYLASMLIAFSFVPVMCAFCHNAAEENKVAGFAAMLFAAAYAVIILLVYFAQLTAVRLGALSEQALQILDYSRFGLFFSYDLLGYALMALSTFFAGLTIAPKTRADKWLRRLLLIHGAFFIVCFAMPVLGVFGGDMSGAAWIGTAVLEFWCVYFAPVGVLSYRYFKRRAI